MTLQHICLPPPANVGAKTDWFLCGQLPNANNRYRTQALAMVLLRGIPYSLVGSIQVRGVYAQQFMIVHPR